MLKIWFQLQLQLQQKFDFPPASIWYNDDASVCQIPHFRVSKVCYENTDVSVRIIDVYVIVTYIYIYSAVSFIFILNACATGYKCWSSVDIFVLSVTYFWHLSWVANMASVAQMAACLFYFDVSNNNGFKANFVLNTFFMSRTNALSFRICDSGRYIRMSFNDRNILKTHSNTLETGRHKSVSHLVHWYGFE